jgi:hypothetical protein
MKRAVSCSIVLVLALMALPFAQMSSAAGGRAEVHHTIIAASGNAAPAGGIYSPFLFKPILNPRDQVVFETSLLGPSTSGVFVGDGTTTSTIALGGNPDPTAGNFGFVNNSFFFTPNGDVVFDVNFSDVFTSNGSTIAPLVRNGDQVPGGGTLTQIGDHNANGHGVLAYTARLSAATATQGIFRTDGANTVAIARDDSAPPTGGTYTLLAGPVINDRGQVAFKAEMTGGSTGFAIFRADGADLTPVFLADQIAPGGATFQDFGSPAINAHGQVAAGALLTNSAGGAGLFLGDGTNTVAIALLGQPAPKGGNYSGPGFFSLRLNDRGEVAFIVILNGGTSDRGVFRGNGDQTTTVALSRTIAPGTTGTFESFDDIKLVDDGRVAVLARLAVGVGGVDLSNNKGLWIGTSEADLQLVVRTGDVIGGKVLTDIPNNVPFDMNKHGVAWLGTFTFPSRAIVFSRILGDDDAAVEQDGSDQAR